VALQGCQAEDFIVVAATSERGARLERIFHASSAENGSVRRSGAWPLCKAAGL
jgi:hypothetical protein